MRYSFSFSRSLSPFISFSISPFFLFHFLSQYISPFVDSFVIADERTLKKSKVVKWKYFCDREIDEREKTRPILIVGLFSRPIMGINQVAPGSSLPV